MIIDVSVLITCKDKEPYLDECITSVVRQTKTPKEIIVVHDECTEPVHHVQATTIMLKTNLGVCRARQEAFRFSTGKLILFLDGDDMISPDYLEKMALVIGEGGADIAYPDIYFFGNEVKQLTVTPDPLGPAYAADRKKLPIPVTCLMKREVYETLGGFVDFPVLEDFDFWLRAMCKQYMFKKAQALLSYRQGVNTRNSEEAAKLKRISAEILNQFTIEGDTIKKNE